MSARRCSAGIICTSETIVVRAEYRDRNSFNAGKMHVRSALITLTIQDYSSMC